MPSDLSDPPAINALGVQTASRFDAMDRRFEAVDRRFDGLAAGQRNTVALLNVLIDREQERPRDP